MSSEASHMFGKIKQKLCVNMSKGAAQQLYCVDKNNLKSNDFRQFAMRNGLLRRNKFPDK